VAGDNFTPTGNVIDIRIFARYIWLYYALTGLNTNALSSMGVAHRYEIAALSGL